MVVSTRSHQEPKFIKSDLKKSDKRWIKKIAQLMFPLCTDKEQDTALPHFMVHVHFFSQPARSFYAKQVAKQIASKVGRRGKKRGPGRPRKVK